MGLLIALVLGTAPVVSAGEVPAGRTVERTVAVDGRERGYQVYLPAERSVRPAIILVFHGEGGTPETIARYTEFNDLADAEGGAFIPVYPRGIGKNWDYRPGVPVTRSRGVSALWYEDTGDEPDDGAFVRAVVDDVARSFGADRSRVFATGISSGAFFCHSLVAEAADLVAGIGPVSGGMTEPVAEDFAPAYPVSLVAIQGTGDPLLPIRGGRIAPFLPKVRGRVIPAEEAVGKYLELNGIEGEPTVRVLADRPGDPGTSTRKLVYPPGDHGFRVILYRVAGGGHNWPGRARNLPIWMVGRASQDFDGSRALWESFRECPPRRLGGRERASD